MTTNNKKCPLNGVLKAKKKRQYMNDSDTGHLSKSSIYCHSFMRFILFIITDNMTEENYYPAFSKAIHLNSFKIVELERVITPAASA